MTESITAIFCAMIAAASAISVAVINRRAEKQRGQDRETAAADRRRAEARADRRARESRLSMDLMSATCELSVVTATALRDHHTNGALEPALKKARRAQEEYQAFLKDETARAVADL